jgi:DNA-binding PadR family transcriptional regulator
MRRRHAMFCADSDFIFDFDFGFGPRRGRRARWRLYERGDLKFVILRLVSERPMHGYEVMKALKEESGGYYQPSPGSVYPTLQMLEDEGYLSSEERDGKKVYTITDEGRAYLEENKDVVEDVFERVEQFTDRFFGRDMKKLSKSFSRIAQLTLDEAFRWGTGREDLEAMTEVLERAAEELDQIRRQGGRQRRTEESAEE